MLVRNREGFLVNRLFVPYLKEAFWLLEEGAEPAAIDRAMVEFGFAMGPLALIDMSGLDILVLTDAVLRRAFPQHGAAVVRSPLRLVERGHLGQKTGAGVYRYEPGDHTPHASDVAGGDHRAGAPRAGGAPRRHAERRDRRPAGAADGGRGVSRARRGDCRSGPRTSTWPWCWAPGWPISAAAC